jgi:hypothetical protein
MLIKKARELLRKVNGKKPEKRRASRIEPFSGRLRPAVL